MLPKELSRDVKSLAVPLTLSGRTTKVSSRTAKVLLLDWVVLMDDIVDIAVQTSLIRLGSVADSSCGVFCMKLSGTTRTCTYTHVYLFSLLWVMVVGKRKLPQKTTNYATIYLSDFIVVNTGKLCVKVALKPRLLSCA